MAARTTPVWIPVAVISAAVVICIVLAVAIVAVTSAIVKWRETVNEGNRYTFNDFLRDALDTVSSAATVAAL